MTLLFQWHTAETGFFQNSMDLTFPQASIAIAVSLIAYLLYYYIAHSETLLKQFNEKFDKRKSQIFTVLFQKIIGFVFMALIPGIAFYFVFDLDFTSIGITWYHFINNWLIFLILAAILIPVNYFAAQNPVNLGRYPQMRIKEWTCPVYLANMSGWTLYLISYEYLFRGILLFSTYEAFGLWPAIAINVAIYSAIHMVNSRGEAIGAIIFGTITCLMTIWSGTILLAIAAHIFLALSHESFAIKFNSEMNFVKRS